MFQNIKFNLSALSGGGRPEGSAEIDDEIVDPENKFGALWENKGNVDACRECQTKFQQFLKRKHHCYNCAGIFCEICAQSPSKSEKQEKKRTCNGCKRGECPGDSIKVAIRTELEGGGSNQEPINGTEPTPGGNISKQAAILKKRGQDIEKKMNKMIGAVFEAPSSGSPPAVPIQLLRGNGFAAITDSDARSEVNLPANGYFEFVNKSGVFCCVKLLISTSHQQQKFEIPRPSYISVPPMGTIHGFFEPDIEILNLLVLFDNPNILNSKKTYNFDTRGIGMTIDKISDFARVDAFRKVASYHIACKDRNVLLKHKGMGFVKPRHGDSIGRIGLFQLISGKRSAEGQLDYSTNVNFVRLAYTLSA